MTARPNVGDSERILAGAAGALVTLLGFGRRDLMGLLMMGAGGALIHHGITGRSPLYDALGIDTAHERAWPEDYETRGIHVVEAFLIDRSPEDLYADWRRLENLPDMMSHLKSVRVIDERRSHWVAEAPSIAGGEVEWDAEIMADEPGARIAWQSLEGADVDNRGSVEFSPAPGERGTVVRVVLDYLAPAGRLGQWTARLFGQAPERQIREDLRNFKRMMEVGELVTTLGQPQGTCTSHE